MFMEGQQDNSAIGIASRTNDGGIDWKDWYSVAGGESAFIAFNPDAPELVLWWLLSRDHRSMVKINSGVKINKRISGIESRKCT